MLALTVVVLWFGVVAVYLVRQWWMSELAQAREGVPAPAPVTLSAAPAPPAPPVIAAPAPVATAAPAAKAPALTYWWSGMHAASSAAR